jgi:hypothetical protein
LDEHDGRGCGRFLWGGADHFTPLSGGRPILARIYATFFHVHECRFNRLSQIIVIPAQAHCCPEYYWKVGHTVMGKGFIHRRPRECGDP